MFKIIITVKDLNQLKKLPASENFSVRLNTSHVDETSIKKILENYEYKFPLYLDLKGSKMRTCDAQKEFYLAGTDQVYVNSSCEYEKTILIDEEIMNLIKTGMKILIDDGKIQLEITSFDSRGYRATVVKGGKIRKNKGFNISPHPIVFKTLSERDSNIVNMSKNYDFVRYALSFVGSREEVNYLKNISGKFVAAKIERDLSFDTIAEISRRSDELWFCRGDLGSQLGFRNLASFYLSFSKKMSEMNVPVIMAGEVLEFMVENPRPTRTEICHLYDLIDKGYSGIVLSDETTYGKYPEEIINFLEEMQLI